MATSAPQSPVLPAAGARSPYTRLPRTAHTGRPWRIHELTPDFRVEDVWLLPTPGGPDDFARLVTMLSSRDPSEGSSGAVGTLWAIRRKLGETLGWDAQDEGLGGRVQSLRDRLSPDLQASPGPALGGLPFRSLYLRDDEWAAELANRTVHAVVHYGWVPVADGGFTGQMAILVKPNGLLGRAYMAAINPFRHTLIYPSAMRRLARDWGTS